MKVVAIGLLSFVLSSCLLENESGNGFNNSSNYNDNDQTETLASGLVISHLSAQQSGSELSVQWRFDHSDNTNLQFEIQYLNDLNQWMPLATPSINQRSILIEHQQAQKIRLRVNNNDQYGQWLSNDVYQDENNQLTALVNTFDQAISFTSQAGAIKRHEISTLLPSSLYIGDNNGQGVDLVVVAEGYQQQELEQFYQDASAFIDAAFEIHPLAVHLAGWNIHFLALPSNESGADGGDFKAQQVDTLFDAGFYCGGTERLLCVDQQKVMQTVVSYVPQYDQVLVLVNSKKYGGAGYQQLATASLAQSAVDLIRHELGHSFANLADEYDYGKNTPPLNEPHAANVTLESDVQNVKWQHWLDDQNDVGLFEGAVYYGNDVYRATEDSLMRTLGQPFFEVNSEAWALSVYEQAQPVLTKSPNQNMLSLDISEPQWFALALRYEKNVSRVDWYINDQLQSSDLPSALQFKADQIGSYQIKAVVSDESGVIRKDEEQLSGQTILWQVEVGL